MVLAAEETQAQLERILQNKNLRLSEVQRRLLTYLAERSLSGEADDLKEYTIGIDAFGKPPSYDPRQESVVRMHVARLRQKLAEYYRTDGAEDPVIIDLPKGGFKVLFEPRPVPVAPVAIAVPDPPPPSSSVQKNLILATCAVVLLAGIGYFSLRSSRSTQAVTEALAGWSPDLRQLWTPLLSPTRPLVVCIADPTFGTASGAFRLGQFLGSRKPDLLVTRGNQLSMPEIAMNNIVFLGPANGNRQVQAIPVDQQFVLEPNGIRNLRPKPGEMSFITDRLSEDGRSVEESYALISLTPGLYGNGEILYLSGNQASSVLAAVKVFTDPKLATGMVTHLKTPAGKIPRYYQVVVRVRSMDEMPVDISYLYHRELSGSQTTTP